MKISASITRIKKYMSLADVINEATERTIQEVAPLIINDFLRTTIKWKQSAKFSLKRNNRAASGTVSISVITKDKVWRWVNYGTRPKSIRPVRAPRLRFLPRPYSVPITTPGTLRTRRGRSATQSPDYPHQRYRLYVHDNFIHARNFHKVIQKRWAKRLSPYWRRHFKSLRSSI
jgi:hypothetical protein